MARPLEDLPDHPKSTIAVRTEIWKIGLLRRFAREEGRKLQETLSPYVDMRARQLLEKYGMTEAEALEEYGGGER